MLGLAEALEEAEGDGVPMTEPPVVPQAAHTTSASASAQAPFMART